MPVGIRGRGSAYRARAGHRTRPWEASQMRQHSARHEAIRPAPSSPLLHPSVITTEPLARAATCTSRCACCCERCTLKIGMYPTMPDRVLRGRCFIPPATGYSWSRNGGLTRRRRTSLHPAQFTEFTTKMPVNTTTICRFSATVHSRRRSRRAGSCRGSHISYAGKQVGEHPDDGRDRATPPNERRGGRITIAPLTD